MRVRWRGRNKHRTREKGSEAKEKRKGGVGGGGGPFLLWTVVVGKGRSTHGSTQPLLQPSASAAGRRGNRAGWRLCRCLRLKTTRRRLCRVPWGEMSRKGGGQAGQNWKAGYTPRQRVRLTLLHRLHWPRGTRTFRLSLQEGGERRGRECRVGLCGDGQKREASSALPNDSSP